MAYKPYSRTLGPHVAKPLTTDGLLQEVTGSIVFTVNTLAVEGVGNAVTVINSLATTNQSVDLPDTSGTVDVTP